MTRTLHCERHHFHCDNQLPAALEIEPGDSVDLAVRDASDGQSTRDSTGSDVARLDFARVNLVHGAEPGDALVVEVLELGLGSWRWTAIIPGFGLLAANFTEPFLHLSRYDARGVEFLPGVVLPSRPFIGTAGVAPAEPGQRSVPPPRRVGGNLDVRDLIAGTRAYFPVELIGGKLSMGDTHAAQGDGEVCGTAIETSLVVRVRVSVEKRRALRYPRLVVPKREGSFGAEVPDWHPLLGLHRAARVQLVASAIHRAALGPNAVHHARRANPIPAPLAACAVLWSNPPRRTRAVAEGEPR